MKKTTPSPDRLSGPALKPRWEVSAELVRALSGSLDVEALRPIDFVTVRTMRLANLFNRWLKDALSSHFALSLAEWKGLMSLGDAGPLTAAQLCRLTDTDKGQMSVALRALESKGLITAQENIGKAVVLKLTREGVKLFNRAVALLKEEEKRLLSKLSAAQRIALYEAISLLATSYEEHTPNIE